jgi:N-formylglutamate amidohydrolase
VPRLFAGALPALSFGTNDGRSASELFVAQAMAAAGSDYASVLNGRFKGGWITRHYGRPESGVQAIQLEIAQSAYLDEADPVWNSERAAGLQAMLRRLVLALMRR